jgi:peptidoglycan/xylan/chitin deacetylase (PgdA/CDA1 family)
VAAEPLHQGRRTTKEVHGQSLDQEPNAAEDGSFEQPCEQPFAGPDICPVEAPWILMYHSVDTYQEDPYLVTVSPERFARQMAWLARNGLRGVSVCELLEAHAAGRSDGLVGLTFDDGYADLPRQALPVLERHGFTATAYVVAGRLGGHNIWDEGPRKRLLSAEQIRRLAGAGIEIGCHSMYHRSLPGLSREALFQETRSSRERLEDVVERPVTGFCYPYGALDQPAVDAVRAGGYEYATAIEHGPLTSRWALPRSYVGERDNGLRLRAKQARHRMRGLRTRTDGEQG